MPRVPFNVLGDFHFPQKQAKARHHEAEAHQRQSGANPSQERAFRGQRNAGIVKDRTLGLRCLFSRCSHKSRMMKAKAFVIKNVCR